MGEGRGRSCFKIVKRVQKLIFKKFRLSPKKVGSGLPKKREASMTTALNFFSLIFLIPSSLQLLFPSLSNYVISIKSLFMTELAIFNQILVYFSPCVICY